MAYNIPMEDSTSTALSKGFTQGSNLYNMLMQNALKKEQSKRAEAANRRAEQMQPITIQHIMSQIANANSANQRAEGLYPEHLKHAKNLNDPDYDVNKKINMIEKLKEHFGKKTNNQKSVIPTTAEEAPSYIPSIFGGEQKGLPTGSTENPDVINMSEEQIKELEKNLIPEQKKDVVSEYDAAQQNEEKPIKYTPEQISLGKSIEKATGYNPFPEEKLSPFDLYVKKRQYDLENPKPNSGKTKEQIDKEQDFKLKELQAKIDHWKKLEENSATVDQKLKNQLEVIKAKKDMQLLVNKQKQEAVYKGQLDKEQAKLYSKMQEEGIAGIKSSPKFNELLDIIGSDTFKSIRKHPGLPTLEMFKNKKVGTAEQQHLIGQFENITNEVIADMAKGLNPRFTNKDLELAKAMKISEKDSYQSAMAKAENIVYLHELGQQRIDKALELIEKKKLPPYFAIKQADSELNSDIIRKEIRNKLHIETEKKPQQSTIKYSPNDMVKIDMGNGKIETMKYSEALRRGYGQA